MPESKDEQIAQIMDNMNWAKIHKTMVLLNWTWWSSAPESPTIEQLKENGRSYLERVWVQGQRMKSFTFIGSGGFTARYEHWEAGPILSLAFELSEHRFDPEWTDSVPSLQPYNNTKKLNTLARNY